MAQKVQVILVDDLDGGEATETVTFGLDGVSYEIDLSESNAAKLRDSLAEWVGHARRAGSAKSGGRTRTAVSSPSRSRGAAKPDLGAVRSWARENGFQVSDRGRVSSEVLSAYEAAH
ncbi:MAG: Lsr2 family protein [Kineosporiaceae bacterium]